MYSLEKLTRVLWLWFIRRRPQYAFLQRLSHARVVLVTCPPRANPTKQALNATKNQMNSPYGLVLLILRDLWTEGAPDTCVPNLKQTKSVINSVLKELRVVSFVAINSPKNWGLIFHHLEVQRTAHNIHFDRNVHRIDTFNLKQKVQRCVTRGLVTASWYQILRDLNHSYWS